MTINLNSPISEIINTRISTLHPKDTIKHAEQLFMQSDRRILPVIVGGKYRGVLHHNNFHTIRKAHSFYVKVANKALDVSAMKVEDFYSAKVVTLSTEAYIKDAIELFVKCRQYYIPIVDDDEFIGLVTSYDFCKYVLENNSLQK